MKIDFSRSAGLLGDDKMARLKTASVAVVGVGGVGGWCAEALVRTGIGQLTLVDDDMVVPSNLNRQCAALSSTIGSAKVEAMKNRLLAINPECRITACARRLTKFEDLGCGFDFIVDAIDSVDCKAELILGATANGVKIVSSMGAALRADPTKVEVRRFDKVEGDGLAKALRQRFKKLGRYPAPKFNCVCSRETQMQGVSRDFKPSIMPVVCAFGMALAAEVIKEL